MGRAGGPSERGSFICVRCGVPLPRDLRLVRGNECMAAGERKSDGDKKECPDTERGRMTLRQATSHFPQYAACRSFILPISMVKRTFLWRTFERQCAHSRPPALPAAAKIPPPSHTNGRRRAHLGRPRAPTRRSGARVFLLIKGRSAHCAMQKTN